jgi:hypothetical protein
VRAVIEETLQRPVIAPMLGELERELGPVETARLTRECVETLVARGWLDDESWLRADARPVVMDTFTLGDAEPLRGVRTLRALWALGRAPKSVLACEALAREFEARSRAMSGDGRERDEGPAELCWLVVERARTGRTFPIVTPEGAAVELTGLRERWRAVLAPSPATTAALDREALPPGAYCPEAETTTPPPLLSLAHQQHEDSLRWDALCAAGARFDRDTAAVERLLAPARWGAEASRVTSPTECARAIVREGFALWTALPRTMVLIATVIE